jgi:hypothetical protein
MLPFVGLKYSGEFSFFLRIISVEDGELDAYGLGFALMISVTARVTHMNGCIVPFQSTDTTGNWGSLQRCRRFFLQLGSGFWFLLSEFAKTMV